MFNKKLAIVGASGAVGRVFLELLDEKYPGKKDLHLVASKRSAGNKMSCGDEEFVIQDIENFNFSNVDIAFFSAGSSVSKIYAPIATKADVVVIDNTSEFRYVDNIPLIVHFIRW